MKRLITAALLASALTAGGASVVGAADSTCSALFGFPHGYHIVADYVDGTGSEFLGFPGIDWPPRGVNARGGAALPGGPGPNFHFLNGVAPGASFCNLQSKSPGLHIHPMP